MPIHYVPRVLYDVRPGLHRLVQWDTLLHVFQLGEDLPAIQFLHFLHFLHQVHPFDKELLAELRKLSKV